MRPKLNKADRERLTFHRERRKALAEAFEAESPEGRLAYIPAGHPPSEFEIQAFIYQSLKELGCTVRGEVMTKCGTCIFDIVVYVDNKPVRIIETKKTARGKGSRTARRRERKCREQQVSRYAAFGIPVDLVATLSAAREYVANFPKP